MKTFIKWLLILCVFTVPVMCAACNGCQGQAGSQGQYEDMTGEKGHINLISGKTTLTFTECTVTKHFPRTMTWVFEFYDEDIKDWHEMYWQGSVLFEPAKVSYKRRKVGSSDAIGTPSEYNYSGKKSKF